MNHIPSLPALQNTKKTAKTLIEEQNLFPQNLSYTSLFAKDQKTAKPLKKKIFLLKSYPPHLSLQNTKKTFEEKNISPQKLSSASLYLLSLLSPTSP